MTELEKLLATRRDARVAVVGPAEVVSKYIAETEENVVASFAAAERGGTILVFDESDELLGKRGEIERHDGPVVLGVRSLASIPAELRTNLVVVKAPRRRWRLFGGSEPGGAGTGER
jgi:SpoVK/Ycf46/Vps4 family AAA+-type ATPase